MASRLIILSILVLTTSCFVDKDSFCNKYDADKNIIIENYLDSLKNQSKRPKTLENYFLLGEFEQAVSLNDININSRFRYHYANDNLNDCKAYLKLFDYIKSEKYLRETSNGKIISYVPVLTVNKLGKVRSIESIIKYENGKIDTVADQETVDLSVLVNKELKTLLKERQLRVANWERDNEKRRKEREKIERQQEQQRIENEKRERKRILDDLVKNAISAKGLCRVYRENEIRADKQFLNRTIIIKGVVTSVDRTFGEVSINLEGDEFLTGVSCITTDEEVASKLRKGQSVVIEGTCKGIDEITKTLVTITDSKIRAY